MSSDTDGDGGTDGDDRTDRDNDRDADDVRRRWEQRSRAYSPEYYAYYGSDERSDRLREVLAEHVDRDAAVLELGCSSGRHLAHLLEHGYSDLAGIDLNADAFDVMGRTYPDLAATGTFHRGAIESVVPSFEDDRFDVVYSVETLQHLHPSCDRVFADLARVTSEVLVTAEVEPDPGRFDSKSDPEPSESDSGSARARSSDGIRVTSVDGVTLYKRHWDRALADAGFVERRSIDLDRVTMRVFRSTGSNR
ncbi:class I SAM-dependent methyltransferase [Halosolutus gelatinilyticus]|uniref:class I SAM-dependent methyltransferase n=1 Tax=Halosolutus gelatinilyticus TaxID=2931975 RepID=UPI001FF4DEDB|nr:class I SAM-dependent methyltransferase [Halosolutus gelatinilyticus]